MIEYSASMVSKLLWFVETRETAKLLENHSEEEVLHMTVGDNIYQQKAVDRRKRVYYVALRRLKGIPEALIKMMIHSDINTANVKDFDARKRVRTEKFMLRSSKYSRGKDYYLVLADMEDETKEHHRYKFEIDIAGI